MIFKCKHCDKKFFSQIGYNQHLEVKHGKLSPKQQRELANAAVVCAL